MGKDKAPRCPVLVPKAKGSPFLMPCGEEMEIHDKGVVWCPRCKVGWSDGKEPQR